MRAICLAIPLVFGTALPLSAQRDERDVLAVVRQLFDGMRERDTAKMRALLHSDARLVSAADRNGVPVAQIDSPSTWLQGVMRATGGTLDERIRNPVVKVDGGLASVWVEYSFYLGDQLRHCGVDAFHLVKTAEGWRIVDLADTRHREGCTP